MKKEYINPEIEVLNVRIDTVLQSTSELHSDEPTNATEPEEARFHDMFDEDDEW